MEEKNYFEPYYKNKNYLISQNGDVYSLHTNKILKHRIDSGGYHMVNISVDGGPRKNVWVHRMVAETFLENPHNFKYVNHIDEDKSNNNVSNLEFCDNSYNNNSVRKKKQERVSSEDVKYIREQGMRPCEALRYLHEKGYTVRNKCARMIVNRTSYKNV